MENDSFRTEVIPKLSRFEFVPGPYGTKTWSNIPLDVHMKLETEVVVKDPKATIQEDIGPACGREWIITVHDDEGRMYKITRYHGTTIVSHLGLIHTVVKNAEVEYRLLV
jgi:hypothetical protein